MAKVNPPPQLRIPPQFLKDKETRKFFEQQNQILFQLFTRTGGSVDFVSNALGSEKSAYTSLIFDTRLKTVFTPVTIDTTGFTIDTTEQHTDKTKV